MLLQKSDRRLLLRLAFIITAALGITKENAFAGGVSAPGFTSGIPVYAKLPEGLYYLNQTSSSFRSVNGIDTRANTNIFFNYYQSPWEVAGGALSFVLAPTLFEYSTSTSSHQIGFYNTYLAAQITWPTGFEGLRFGYRLGGYIPQGGPIAFDYGAIEHRGGLTYLDSNTSILANFMYGTPVGDDASDNAPNYFLSDFHFLKTFGKWQLGPIAHWSADVSRPNSYYKKQSQVAIGGLLAYNFGNVTLQGKITHDIYERNYGDKETTVWTNIIVPINWR